MPGSATSSPSPVPDSATQHMVRMRVARHGHDRRLLEIAAGIETMLAQKV